MADALARDIGQGLYAPGDRLPSVRELTRRLAVSTSTVVEAYGRLIDRGLVESRPQSGFFVRVRGDEPQAPAMSRPRIAPTPVSVGEIAMEVVHAASDRSLVTFGSAQPNLDLPAARAVRGRLGAAARRLGERALAYEIPPGDKNLRAQIARRAIDAGYGISAGDVVVTSGCQEAMVLCLRAIANPGDTIAVESPTFYGTLQAIRSLGLRALEIPTHPETGMSLESLEMAIAEFPVKGCVLTPHGSNPLGYVMPDEQKAALVRLLEGHDVPIVEDDIFGELVYGSPRPRSLKAWDTRGQVLVCSSVSKSIAPGLRVGWVIPGRWLREVSYLKLVTSMASATLPQLAVSEYLATGDYDRHLRAARAFYRQSRDRLVDLVGRHFPRDTRVTRPAGGFVAWLELPKTIDAVALYRRALVDRISIAPGTLFSAREKYRHFVRINFARGWGPRTVDAIKRLGELAATSS
ncbi:MAG TPA: PLP-dependent aminotransferase family protein [Polyangiaceae bacterium]|nr:PLP-dependent aminotransferase family protein [Polyangiaceae bacterium]